MGSGTVRLIARAVVVALGATACTSTPSDPTVATPSISPRSLPSESADVILAELDLESLAGPVSALRGLEFTEPVEVQIVDDNAYRAQFNELAAAPLVSAPDTQSSWLHLLGVLPDDVDVRIATGRLLQTSVAMYDAAQNRLLVRASTGTGPYVEAVVVHELVHALQIQNFGQPQSTSLDGDLGYVYTAIVEGDAQRITDRFIASFSQSDDLRYEEGRLAVSEDSAAIRGSTARYVIENLAVPAEDGLRFLQDLDNAAVDRFLADPDQMSTLPSTSEELLTPTADLEIAALTLQSVAVPTYQPLTQGTLGAGRLRILLRQALDPQVADQAVIGWGADRLEVHVSGDDLIFVYAFKGDSVTDAQELAAAFRLLLDTNLAEDAYDSVRVADDEVLVLAGSDPAVEEWLDDVFGDFGEEVFLVQLP